MTSFFIIRSDGGEILAMSFIKVLCINKNTRANLCIIGYVMIRNFILWVMFSDLAGLEIIYVKQHSL